VADELAMDFNVSTPPSECGYIANGPYSRHALVGRRGRVRGGRRYGRSLCMAYFLKRMRRAIIGDERSGNLVSAVYDSLGLRAA
jgi:hypothetical protein